MLTKIYAENPSRRELSRVVAVLEHDGVIVRPTDSVYAFACSIRSARAIERLRRMLGKSETRFSALFPRHRPCGGVLPGGQRRVPRAETQPAGAFHLHTDPSVAGARQGAGPASYARRAHSGPCRRAGRRRALGAPLLVASVHDDCETEYTTDPELIAERYGDRIDLVIDGGPGNSVPTTVVDLTQDEPLSAARGRGELA